jgi:hypothetical protein
MGEKEKGPSDQARVGVFSCTWALVASSLVRREGIDGSTLRDDIPLPNHITFVVTYVPLGRIVLSSSRMRQLQGFIEVEPFVQEYADVSYPPQNITGFYQT